MTSTYSNFRTVRTYSIYGLLSLVVFILYFGTFALANAAEWYVRPEGGSYGSGNGTSYTNAFDGFHAIDWDTSVQAGDTVYVCGTHLRDSNSNAYLASQGVFSIRGGTEGNRTALDGSCPGGDQGIMWGAYKDTRDGGMLATRWQELEDGVYYNETKTWHKAFVSNGLYENVDGDDFDKYTQLESSQEVMDSNEDGVYYIEAFGSNQHKVWLRPFNESTFRDEIRWTGAGAWGMWFGSGASHSEVRNMRFHASTFGMSGSATDMLEDVVFKDTVIYPHQSGVVFNPFHAHDLVFDGIEIAYAGEGIYVYYRNNSTVNNVTIKNSYFHDIGAPWVDDKEGIDYTPDGHAIGIQNMDNYSITNNRFERVPSGINFHMGGSVSFTQKHIDIIGNYFNDLRGDWGRVAKGAAIVFDGHNGMPKGQSEDITIAHNVITNCEGSGITSTRKDVVNFYNNTVVNCSRNFNILGSTHDGPSAHAYNNISLNPRERYFYFNENGVVNYEFRADNNVYYPEPTTTGDFYFLVTSDGVSNPAGTNPYAWPGWTAAHSARYPGTEANTIITNPFPGKSSFATVADLTPELGSPVIDSGKDVGQTVDFLGNPIYGTPDRGAIEYQPPYTLGVDGIYEGHSIRVYADGKYRYFADPDTNAESAMLRVQPFSGFGANNYSHFADVTVDEWGDNDNKAWTVTSGGSISGFASFTVDGLDDFAFYELHIDNDPTGIVVKADANGEANFSFDGGTWNDTLAFSIEETNTAPTPEPEPEPTPTGDLVAHWTFDKDDTVLLATDVTGNGNPGIFNGFSSPTLVPGALGDAMQLDGVNDFVNLNPVRTSLAGDTTTSIALWVKTSKAYTGSTFGSILGINTGTGGNTALLSVGHNGSGNAFDNQFSIFDGVSGSFEGDTNTIVADGTWHHLTYVRNGSVGTLFVDGVQKATHAPNFTFSGTDTWSLGMDYDGTRTTDHFQGAIDDVRVYNKALSANEVAQLSDNGSTPTPWPTPTGDTATYRFIKWNITDRRANENSIQAAEFELMLGGNTIGWPAGTTATNPQGYSPSDERSEHLIDGQTAKWLDFNFSANGPGGGSATRGKSEIVIDTGGRVTFDSYRWRTANDHSGRDPIAWEVYGSNDGNTWTLLNTQTNANVPTTRNTYGSVYALSGGSTPNPTPGTGATPIIEFVGAEENGYGGDNEAASIEIEVDITAYDGDIYIPRNMAYHDEVTKVGYIKYYVETDGDKLSMGELESVSGNIDTTAEEVGTEFYKINDGEVETFWFTVTIDPVESGFYRAGLQSPLQYLTSTNGTVHTRSFSESNFRSNYIQINGGTSDVPPPEPTPTVDGDHRFIKWEVTERRGSANSIQATEFELMENGNTVAWPAGTTATNPGGRNPNAEKPEKAIDGGNAKWLDFEFADSDSTLVGSAELVIDTVTGVDFDGYRLKTADDFSSRDPIGWKLYVSDDGSDWELVDERSDARVPTSRNTFTDEFDLGNFIIPTFSQIMWTVTERRGTANSIQAAEFEVLVDGDSVSWPAGTTATNPGGRNPNAEKPEKAIDGGNAKWLDFEFADSDSSKMGESMLLIDAGSTEIAFSGYRFKTANDFNGRDPVGWEVSGSNDGETWVLLDTQSNESVPTARNTFTSTYTFGSGSVLGASTEDEALDVIRVQVEDLTNVIDQLAQRI